MQEAGAPTGKERNPRVLQGYQEEHHAWRPHPQRCRAELWEGLHTEMSLIEDLILQITVERF